MRRVYFPSLLLALLLLQSLACFEDKRFLFCKNGPCTPDAGADAGTPPAQ
jgi:hypothetical protein